MHERLVQIINTIIDYEFVDNEIYKHKIRCENPQKIVYVEIDFDHHSQLTAKNPVENPVEILEFKNLVYIGIHPKYELEFQQWLRLLSA